MIYRKMFGLPAWDSESAISELERMRRQMDRMLEGWSGQTDRAAASGVFPPLNLTEGKDGYFVRAELPGVTVADLDIQATGNTLSIAGERKAGETESGARFHRREREAGKFSRVINLPEAVETGKISANLTNGILTVSIPKSEKMKPRQIAVA